MDVRLGHLLMQQGILTAQQAEQILAEQRRSGKPFGVLCERMFNVDPKAVEQAWAVQYAKISRTVNPLHESIEARALALVTRRQAWQFRVLPMRFDGPDLMMATTQQHLRRALRFATSVLGVPVYLVLAEPRNLGEALCRHYPMAGMTPESIDDDRMEQLVHRVKVPSSQSARKARAQ
jgi:hypothetical protein